MRTSLSSEQQTPVTQFEASSPIVLLERGLRCVQEGRYPEGVVFFALARELLTANQIQLAVALDAFTEGHVGYWQAQQALQQASKRFVEVETEQQARVADLEKLLPALLPALMEDVQKAQNILSQAQKKSQGAQEGSLLHSSSPIVPEDNDTLPELYFSCFGHFEVMRSGQPVVLCSNRNGQAILRYLITQVGHRATMDTLMAVLWPDEEAEVAHHKLQVAISALRRSLNNGYISDSGGGYILCKNRVYQLNPAISLHSDVDEFLAFYQSGQQSNGSVAQYEKACQLYTGPFLTEDIYTDWSSIRREQLSQAYLAMCSTLSEHYLETGHYEDAVKWATATLKESPCDEAAHRQLIRAYVALGRRSEALRQYQRCQQVLAEELDVQPMPETVKLFHTLVLRS